MFGLHGWISGVCWINRGWRRSTTAIITCALRGKRHFLRNPEKPLKIKNKFKTCSIPDIKSLVNKNSVFFLFCPMDIFIPSLLTKNNLRQLLLSAGKRWFLRDHEVVVSNGWLLYSGFHSYLLKGGVRGGGYHPTREAKNTLRQEGQIYKSLFWMTSLASSSASLHIYPIMLTSSYSRPHNRRVM